MAKFLGELILSHLDSFIYKKKSYFDPQEGFIDNDPENKIKNHCFILDKNGNFWDVDYITSKGEKIKFE